jgi:hypothetical protein
MRVSQDPVQHMHEHSAVIYSDTHGQTWVFANRSLVGPGTTESEVVELQHTPGTLMFNHRSLNVCGPPYQG